MAPKRRRARKKRRTDVSDDSSSDSSSEEEQAPVALEPAPPAAEAPSSSSEESSSESSSSSDSESDAPQRPVQPKPNGLPIADVPKRKNLANRPRSPSPPYFSFNEADVLAAPAVPAPDPEQEAMRAFYLEKVVNAYGQELDAFKQEPGIANRLDRLVASLASGADLMTTCKLGADLSIWATKGTSDRELFLQSRGPVEGEDVDMA